MRNLVALLMLGALAACGQTGKLYLPDAASEVVTRPAATPPEPEKTGAPNSPQTPAPEVPAPESEPKKDKGASPPQPR
jgi:predicted small lipoprotein YifL